MIWHWHAPETTKWTQSLRIISDRIRRLLYKYFHAKCLQSHWKHAALAKMMSKRPQTPTVRIILTNFTTYVKILCNLRHFYNDLDRRCKISWISHSHMKKLWPARGSNWWPLDLKSDTLPLSYGALHARENIIVDFELGVGLKLDNFHSFMNSAMQSSVAQG